MTQRDDELASVRIELAAARRELAAQHQATKQEASHRDDMNRDLRNTVEDVYKQLAAVRAEVAARDATVAESERALQTERDGREEAVRRMKKVEATCAQLRERVQSLSGKLVDAEAEVSVLRTKLTAEERARLDDKRKAEAKVEELNAQVRVFVCCRTLLYSPPLLCHCVCVVRLDATTYTYTCVACACGGGAWDLMMPLCVVGCHALRSRP